MAFIIRILKRNAACVVEACATDAQHPNFWMYR